MIPAGFDYLRPATLAEALEMASRDEDATFLAGGHALLPEWKLKATAPSTVIDLGRIAELRGIDGPAVHRPWTLPDDERRTLDYPAPIVDVAEGNRRFLDARGA